MKANTKYQNQTVLVLGLGKSGFNAARLLLKLGAKVTVNDDQEQGDNPQVGQLRELGATVITGSHPLSLFDQDEFAYLFKNPGIRYDNPMVEAAIARDIPVLTEPELAYEVSESPWVSVTGSNGKTTTTTLITLMLNENRQQGQAYAAGNIGNPLSAVVQKATSHDVMVTELSSFQLLGITTVKPKVAVLTNIYEAHLDYHGSRANYVAAKMRLVQKQTADDFFVVNWDLPELRELSHQTKAKVVPFSRLGNSEAGAYVKDGQLWFQQDMIMPVADIKVPGNHNIENALAAIAAAKLMGQSNAAIVSVLTTFTGVKHRMQFVTSYQGRRFYNDSKATNMEATEVALKSFKQPIVLLAGGLDRGFTFEPLLPLLKEHVKAIILYGETKQLLAQTAREARIPVIKIVDQLTDAVPAAYAASASGDVILLSPACASWDQFKTFEERGDVFIKAVQQITE
ncbi:UDP-N-acetylmuramoyl-L-alanine--D-glutamate ligase [Latilactobacillus graminis]|uniref:UDP-N-acetylmuramoylalanine--D-glutamate ligase n=2 Tax=Latilactobacillus graminis TaxID=60519 RepID=A0AA89I1T5_9LACO|nr:UDP-N-acetylmuramoyl-L-alanine--D-glutamate ligase [Latilactobacillus graminis]KRM24032.1 UDP-N-acetylmuramoylalanine--D-glutamate ligase [Latilactobacillus graminis DSM 20719]QFP79805.1 UDP-N-acetylmuramoyl-L-alanine--D-glutamate ligase [Latilactobacillus graminis]